MEDAIQKVDQFGLKDDKPTTYNDEDDDEMGLASAGLVAVSIPFGMLPVFFLFRRIPYYNGRTYLLGILIPPSHHPSVHPEEIINFLDHGLLPLSTVKWLSIGDE